MGTELKEVARLCEYFEGKASGISKGLAYLTFPRSTRAPLLPAPPPPFLLPLLYLRENRTFITLKLIVFYICHLQSGLLILIRSKEERAESAHDPC